MMQNIKGYCPMGCGQTLFVADGGYVTCSFISCPDPGYVSDLLDDRETEHIVKFTDDGFAVRHPLKERRAGLMDCDLHVRLAELNGAPVESGTYRLLTSATDKPWSFQRITDSVATPAPTKNTEVCPGGCIDGSFYDEDGNPYPCWRSFHGTGLKPGGEV